MDVGFSYSRVCFVGLTAVCLLSSLIENMQIFSLMLGNRMFIWRLDWIVDSTGAGTSGLQVRNHHWRVI